MTYSFPWSHDIIIYNFIAGIAKMGPPTDPESVVNHELKVSNKLLIENLFPPTIPSLHDCSCFRCTAFQDYVSSTPPSCRTWCRGTPTPPPSWSRRRGRTWSRRTGATESRATATMFIIKWREMRMNQWVSGQSRVTWPDRPSTIIINHFQTSAK